MPATETTSPWGSQSLPLNATRKWTWFRENFGAALVSRSLAASAGGLDRGALAAAFWQWAGMLDAEARFEKLDPTDYTHYAAGQLLRCLLTHRPLRLPDGQRSEEVRAVTETVLSLLCEWRCALDEQSKRDTQLPSDGDSLWAGYLADTAKDVVAAVAYLDKFCGLEPDWQCPQLVINRPAMRAALESLRTTATRANDR
jgi:hypothetical protein